MRAFTELWERITLERYGVTDPKLRRFRYGMQVNSLGLTEEQPENNVQRIVLEMLGVTLSKDARARAIQLPCWNEALGLPTPWDQQWSLRMQQVLAYETDLLEYDDLFAGSTVVEAKTAELAEAAIGRARVGARRWRGVRDDRRDEGPAGPEQRRAGAAHRVGRADRRGRQLLHRDGAVTPRVARLAALDRRGRPGAPSGSRSSACRRGAPQRDEAAAREALAAVRARRAGFGEPRPGHHRARPSRRNRR